MFRSDISEKGRLKTPPLCTLPVLRATTSEHRFAVIWVDNGGIEVGPMILLSGKYVGGDFAILTAWWTSTMPNRWKS